MTRNYYEKLPVDALVFDLHFLAAMTDADDPSSRSFFICLGLLGWKNRVNFA